MNTDQAAALAILLVIAAAAVAIIKENKQTETSAPGINFKGQARIN